MSLLLDALKKAAKDKQRADASSNDNPAASQKNNQDNEINQAEIPEELDVLEFDIEDPVAEQDQQHIERVEQGYSESEQADQADDGAGDETSEQPSSIDSGKATTTTVSDEALHMLVFKSNNQHRRRRKILLTSAITLSSVTLVLGGLYFYSTMIDDVESLEQKHEIALQSVRAHEVETRHLKASIPVTKSRPMATAKKIAAPVVNARAKKIVAANKPAGKQPAKAVNFKKTSKKNPVSVLLGEAWAAYQRGDYRTAETAYTKVLQQEANNRDGLLGMGAIAIKKGEVERARAAYINLLQLDPRDPIANAALVNLEKAQADTFTESKLKFMLQQQPDAPHLYFALGNIYAQQKLWPQAQKAYFNAWQGDNNNADYAFNLAVSLEQIGKAEQALRFYVDCLKLAQNQNVSFSVAVVKERIAQLGKNI